MFGWLRKIKERQQSRPTFQKYFIVLPGTHSIPLAEIEGVSLKETSKHVFDNHKGLKYCISSEIQTSFKKVSVLKGIQEQVANDIKKSLFTKVLWKNDWYKIVLGDVVVYFIDDRVSSHNV